MDSLECMAFQHFIYVEPAWLKTNFCMPILGQVDILIRQARLILGLLPTRESAKILEDIVRISTLKQLHVKSFNFGHIGPIRSEEFGGIWMNLKEFVRGNQLRTVTFSRDQCNFCTSRTAPFCFGKN